MATKITRDVLESYVHCTYKGHLKLAGEQGSTSDYEVLQAEARSRVRLSAADRLMGRHKGGAILRGVALTRPLLKQGVPRILDATIEDHALSIHFDALQKEVGMSRLGDFHSTRRNGPAGSRRSCSSCMALSLAISKGGSLAVEC